MRDGGKILRIVAGIPRVRLVHRTESHRSQSPGRSHVLCHADGRRKEELMNVQRESLVLRNPPFLTLIAVTIAVLACNMPLLGGTPASPVQTAEGPPAAPPETPTPEPAEAVALDPCSLLTRAEVEAALGTPLGSDAANQLAACAYTAPGMALSLSAAQGEDAKGWLLAGLDLILLFLGDEQATQMREDIVANASSLSVGEVVRQSLPISEIIGYQFQAASELGGPGPGPPPRSLHGPGGGDDPCRGHLASDRRDPSASDHARTGHSPVRQRGMRSWFGS